MKPVYIFRHLACEGPGYLAEVLDRRKIPYQIIRIDQRDPLPESTDAASGLAFMGGPMSVNDPLPWIEPELNLIRQAARGLPVLGHCLGGQLISRALGAAITRNPVKEIGWFPVEQQPNPGTAGWLDGMPPSFDVFHWHGETFSLPAGATPLLRSRYCENQGYVLHNILALQCHVEMTPDMVAEWCAIYAEELNSDAESVQSAQTMQAGIAERVRGLRAVADVLYARWLQPLGT